MYTLFHGFLENPTITPIDKTDDKYYKSVETVGWELWMLASDGFKITDCVWSNTLYTTYYNI